MDAIINVRDVSFFYYPQSMVLSHIDTSVQRGQLVTLLGPNGAGKTTLLNCITGLLYPQDGLIEIYGKDIRKLSPKEIARSIAYVPQRTEVSFDYSVKDFVVMGRTAHLGIFSSPGTKDLDLAEAAMEQLNILQLRDRSINEVSGGEQQRACIARALAQEPNLIVMDEPIAALDFGNQVKVLKLIKQLSAKGHTILMTTHNPEHALLLGSDVWILHKDGSLEEGGISSMITEETLSQLYDADICVVSTGIVPRSVCLIRTLGETVSSDQS